jgi:hypothetical protein
MSRTALAVVALFAALAGGPVGRAQPLPVGAGAREDALDVLQREAKAKFEAMRPTPEEHSRSLKEAAQEVGQAVERLIAAGRAGREALNEWALPLARARRVLREDATASAAELERLWEQAWQREQALQGGVAGQRVGLDVYLEAKLDRLEIEEAWARARKDRPGGAAVTPEAVLPGDELSTRWAQARRQALADDPAGRARERRTTAREGLTAAVLLNWAGVRGPERVEHWAGRVADAEGDDPITAAEQRWRVVQRAEALREGATPALRDTLRRRAILLDADVRLAEAVAASPKSFVPRVAPVDLPNDDPLESGERARAFFDAAHASLPALKPARRDAARRWLDEELRLLRSGQGSSEPVLEAARRLAAAERDLGGGTVEPLEQRWRLAREVEDAQRARYEVGGLHPLPWLASRFERLLAEDAWRQALRPR